MNMPASQNRSNCAFRYGFLRLATDSTAQSGFKGMVLNFYKEIEKGKISENSFISTVFREGKTLYVRRARKEQSL
jgi:hypothetical protein